MVLQGLFNLYYFIHIMNYNIRYLSVLLDQNRWQIYEASDYLSQLSSATDYRVGFRTVTTISNWEFYITWLTIDCSDIYAFICHLPSKFGFLYYFILSIPRFPLFLNYNQLLLPLTLSTMILKLDILMRRGNSDWYTFVLGFDVGND